MVRNKYISLHLESTPLQIKTNSTTGSYDQIWVSMHTAKADRYVGVVAMMFDSPMKYWIVHCTGSFIDSLTVQPPEEVDKIWTIRKTNTTLNIECNRVEVLHYEFSDSSDSRCVTNWGGDVVRKIKFDTGSDSASNSYREKSTGISDGVLIDHIYQLHLNSKIFQHHFYPSLYLSLNVNIRVCYLTRV